MVYVVVLCGWSNVVVVVCTKMLNQCNAIGGEGEVGRHAVDNGWEVVSVISTLRYSQYMYH